jgi:hypothetical protein
LKKWKANAIVPVHLDITRGGAVVACRAHNPEVVGSNPAPATNLITQAYVTATALLSPSIKLTQPASSSMTLSPMQDSNSHTAEHAYLRGLVMETPKPPEQVDASRILTELKQTDSRAFIDSAFDELAPFLYTYRESRRKSLDYPVFGLTPVISAASPRLDNLKYEKKPIDTGVREIGIKRYVDIYIRITDGSAENLHSFLQMSKTKEGRHSLKKLRQHQSEDIEFNTLRSYAKFVHEETKPPTTWWQAVP